MTDQPIPRAERRRLARQMLRSGQLDGLTKINGIPVEAEPRTFWLSFLFMVLFFFVCTVYALVQGLELWAGSPRAPAIIGWAGEGVALLILGWLVVCRRKRMRWTKGIVLVGVPSIFLGLALGLLWTRTMTRWQDNTRYDQVMTQHAGLIGKAENWSPSSVWDAKTCADMERRRDAFVQDAFRGKEPPSPRVVGITLGVEEVLYQAGCKVDWVRTKDAVNRHPFEWATSRPMQSKSLEMAWTGSWPNAQHGCQMQLVRAKAQHRNADVNVLDEVCQALSATPRGKAPWDPERFGGANGMQVPVTPPKPKLTPGLAEPIRVPTNVDRVKPLAVLEQEQKQAAHGSGATQAKTKTSVLTEQRKP
jgi:hypothetical protein